MRYRRGVNWGFRLGLLFSVVGGAAWGFALGVVLVRVNMQFSLLGTIGAAIPAAFLGSLITGLVFQRLWRGWHRVARLLVALLVTAAAMPIGLVWGVNEQRLDAVQLFNSTGALTWNVEWLTAIVGLVAGMWPGWTDPILRLVGRIPRFYLDLLLRFFETMGRAFLWAPLKLLRMVQTEIQDAQRAWSDRPAPAALVTPPTQPRIKPRRLLPKLNIARTRRRAHKNDGPRIVGVVEDRCPYCFDIVKRNDPRGVRVCPVCGAPHHADCWAITGKCQVPHLNT